MGEVEDEWMKMRWPKLESAEGALGSTPSWVFFEKILGLPVEPE